MFELYQDVLAIAKSYMGRVAEEYIQRRCRVSLDISDPASLSPGDIERLAAGIDLTANAYMNEEKARKFRNEILALKQKHHEK